jgi:predicted phosphodiesterase
MSKLAVLSDIHGVWPALRAVEADLAQYGVDQVVVLGDAVALGPSSPQVVHHILDQGWVVVRGNNELALLDYGTARAPAHWRDHSQFAPLGWLDRQMSPALKDAIAEWPDGLELRFKDAPSLRLAHGSPRSSIEGIYPTSTDEKIDAYLAGVGEETLLAGHTHLPLERRSGRWTVLNPGSVGFPIDGYPAAGYMLLEGNTEGWRATFRRVAFDRGAVLAEFERVGYEVEGGIIAQLVVETVRTSRPEVMPFLNWREERYPDQPLSPDMLAEFRREGARKRYMHPAYAAALEEGT